MQNFDVPLHDIKPIIEVQEYSLYYLIGLGSLGVALSLGVLYLIYKLITRKKVFNVRKEHFRLMNELDLRDTKKSAYLITAYGLTFCEDSPRHAEMYKNLTSRLDDYKYKKDVEEFDDEVLGYVELYKEMLDV